MPLGHISLCRFEFRMSALQPELRIGHNTMLQLVLRMSVG
jgi:hypothetical protein